jgi:hypothetical protein
MMVNKPATAVIAFPDTMAAIFAARERNTLIDGHATCEAWRVGIHRRVLTSKNARNSSPV